MSAPQFTEPNLYHLHGKTKGFSVEYSKTSIAGVPLLNVVFKGAKHSFHGDQISTLDSPLGSLVTVTLSATPDLETVTFTLAVPAMNLASSDGKIDTFVVITTNRTSIGGPALVKGQIQTYQRFALTGRAENVVS
jgi:hypothetical protein